MSSNNLRVIYNNVADSSTTTITGSSTAGVTSTTNLKKDPKSLVWRSGLSSTTVVKANLLLTFPSAIIGGVILPFCNLTSEATVRIRGYSGNVPTLGGTIDVPTITATGNLLFDTGNVYACQYQPLGIWGWGTLPLGVNAYSYGGGTYARVWIPEQMACTSLVIEIIDNNPAQYIEVSRVVLGAYWSPKYNTSFGLSTSMKDLSTHERNESGDLVTNRGIKYNSMSFDLKWMTPSDRLDFTRILKGNGLPRPLFISLFPNDSDPVKEQGHQIYGKLSQLAGIEHNIFDMYSTNIDIEEV